MSSDNSALVPSALIDWCQEHERHVLTARWLTNVSNPKLRDPYVEKPDFSAIQTLLIDLKTHAPEGYFNLAATLAGQIPPCYVTQGEREAYRVLARCLRSGVGWPTGISTTRFSGNDEARQGAGK